MILSMSEVAKLKELVIGEADEETLIKCSWCKNDDLNYCKLMDICSRYGAIYRTESGDMMRDLFDTIEYLGEMIVRESKKNNKTIRNSRPK